jgi:hypothetical protein
MDVFPHTLSLPHVTMWDTVLIDHPLATQDEAGFQQASSKLPASFQQASSKLPASFQQASSKVFDTSSLCMSQMKTAMSY